MTDHTIIDGLERSRAFDGFLKIEELSYRFGRFDGTWSDRVTRQVMVRGNAAAILPYDPVRDEVLLIRQVLAGNIQAGVPNRPLQVVAGMVEAGEEPWDVAAREAHEEAGIDVTILRPAQVFMPSPGGSSERVFTFVGMAELDRAGGIHGLAEENEDIRVEVVSADRAIEILDAGEIEAGPAVVVLSWFARHREALRREWEKFA